MDLARWEDTVASAKVHVAMHRVAGDLGRVTERVPGFVGYQARAPHLTLCAKRNTGQ